MIYSQNFILKVKVLIRKSCLSLVPKFLMRISLGFLNVAHSYGAFFENREAQEIWLNIKAIQEDVKTASVADQKTLQKELEEQRQELEKLKNHSSIHSSLHIQKDGSLLQVRLPDPPSDPDRDFRKLIRTLVEDKSPIAQTPNVDLEGIYRERCFLSWPFLGQLKEAYGNENKEFLKAYENKVKDFLKKVEGLCALKEEHLKKKFSDLFEALKKEWSGFEDLNKTHPLKKLDALITGSLEIRTLNQSLFQEIMELLLEQVEQQGEIKGRMALFDHLIHQMAEFTGSKECCLEPSYSQNPSVADQAFLNFYEKAKIHFHSIDQKETLGRIKKEGISLPLLGDFHSAYNRTTFCGDEDRKARENFINSLEDFCDLRWEELREEFCEILQKTDFLPPFSALSFVREIQDLESSYFFERLKNEGYWRVRLYAQSFGTMIKYAEKILSLKISHITAFESFFKKMSAFTGIQPGQVTDD